MNFLKQIKRVITELGTLPFLSLVFFVAVIIALLLTLFGTIESKTLVGFFGVIIGSGIAASTSLLVAQENRRGQLAIASLDRRLETHQKAYAIWHYLDFCSPRGAASRCPRTCFRILEE